MQRFSVETQILKYLSIDFIVTKRSRENNANLWL